MCDILIPMDISLSLNGDVNIVNIVDQIRALNVENVILCRFIEIMNDVVTTDLCGEKYKHNKNERFVRAGKGSRQITTMVGKLSFVVDKVRDTWTGEIFKPLLTTLGIQPYKNFQEDVSWASTDIATKCTFRDTKYVMENFLKETLSPSTINRRVIETGAEIKEFLKNKNKDSSCDEKYEYFYGDGTKSHSQEDRYKNDINVVITTNDQNEKVLLSCCVNKSWDEVSQEVEELNVLSDDAVLISDAEPGLIKSFTQKGKKHQLDFIHFTNDMLYKLWSDNKIDLSARKEIEKFGKKIIYKLKNQVKKYADDKKTLKKKINEAVDELKKLSQYLHEIGCVKSAKFVKKHSNNLVTFAILKTQGKNIPWNSNIIERLMGEIQKRCKHKWMRWTTTGQESILNLILTRYTNTQHYEEFKNKKLKTKNKKNIQTKIKLKKT